MKKINDNICYCCCNKWVFNTIAVHKKEHIKIVLKVVESVETFESRLLCESLFDPLDPAFLDAEKLQVSIKNGASRHANQVIGWYPAED